MPRPIITRKVKSQPNITYFKPAGVRMIDLEEIILTIEEFESIRLKDLEELEQGTAAEKMGVSQPTFHRLINEARKKIANALVNGKAIRIEGGNFEFVGKGRRQGRGFGKFSNIIKNND